ncbi:MAG: AAA family ATPase, partial [Acidobacteriota bacterium]|nr:AAA family ATPase [Acidobacteriota bacterium]
MPEHALDVDSIERLIVDLQGCAIRSEPQDESDARAILQELVGSLNGAGEASRTAIEGRLEFLHPLIPASEIHSRLWGKNGDAPAAAVIEAGSPRQREFDLPREILRLRDLHPRDEALRIAVALGGGATPADHVEAIVDRAYDRAPRDVATRYDVEVRKEADQAPLRPALDLHSDSVQPARPDYTVANIIRRRGTHMFWAEPSAGKTWIMLEAMHELLLGDDDAGACLLEHPELRIHRRYERVVWIATEEESGTLRYKADAVLRGLGSPTLAGRFLYYFAPDRRRPITLLDLPEICDLHKPDAIVLDSLTGLRPRQLDGQRVQWDRDNDATNTIALMLRGLAAERDTDVFVIHHTGRDVQRGYRGPTDWWASADVMVGFQPDGGRTKVVVEKNRDGKRIEPFYLTPEWSGDSYTCKYDGNAAASKLTPTAEKILTFLQARGGPAAQ